MRHSTTLALVAWMAAMICSPPPTLAQDETADLSGTYSNDQITVTLERSFTGYTGVLEVGENRIELSGTQARNGVVTGSYDFNGQTYQFQAAATGEGALLFQAEGRRFVLERQADVTSTDPEGASERQGATDAPNQSTASDIVRNEEWGLEFAVPEGWVGREIQEGRAYLLGWQEREGIVLVLPNRTADLEQLRSEMRQGVQADASTALQITGTVEALGDDGLAADFQGTLDGQQVRAHVATRISPHGQGASVLAAAVPDAFEDAHRDAARKLARSLNFFRPEVPPAVAEWRDRLRGRVLTQFDSYSSGGGGGGYTSRTEIDLCVAGHFHYSGNHQASFNTSQPTGGYVMGERQGAGTWQVVGRAGEPALRLEFHDGKVWEYTLGWGKEIPSSSSRYTSLDGSHYLRTPSKKSGCGQ